MPFRSQAQQRFAFGTGQPWAKRWAAETDFSKLPKRVKRIRSRKVKGCTCKALAEGTAAAPVGPQTRPAAAPAAKPAAGGKGESLGPGITRIRGNLCNVHGKYGPCDKGAAKKPKGGKGKKPPKAAKPKQTPAQRAQARTQQQRANAADVAKRMAESDTGLSPSGSTALLAMRAGTPPDPATGEQLAKMGLAERAADGSYRMTPTGRAVVGAMEAGDYQRAVDTISRGADTATARAGRQSAAAQRRQDVAGKRAAAQMDRTLAQQQRDAKRAAAAAAKKPSGGGGKTPAAAAPTKRQARLSGRAGGGGGSAPSAGSVGGSSPKPKPKPAAPEKQPPEKQPEVSPELATAAQALSAGQPLSDADTQALIRNGLARIVKGELILTQAGQRATRQTTKAQTDEERAMFAKMGGGGGGGGKGGGGGSKLWPKGPSGKRTPQAAAAGGADTNIQKAKDIAKDAKNGRVFDSMLGADEGAANFEARSEFARMTHESNGKQETLPIKSLIAETSSFDPKRIASFMGQSIRKDEAPTVLRYDGKNYLMDGHHRVLSRAALGDKETPVRVYDVSHAKPSGHGVMLPRKRKSMDAYKAGLPGDYLVVEDREKPSTWHLQVKRNGKPDHGLMGAAWAALHGGYRGNKYAGPNAAEALTKLRALYASEKMPLPSEKSYKALRVVEHGGYTIEGNATLPEAYAHAAKYGEVSQQWLTMMLDQGYAYPTDSGYALYEPGEVVARHPDLQAKLDQIRENSRPDLKEFTVYKDASGADRWLSVSSTAYRDRDREIVSTKALTGAVALADASGYRGPLRFWHVPGVELGDCDYQATAQDGRFLIESGTFRSPALAAAVKSHADQYQMSIGFTHPPSEPDVHGVFSNIAIFERSLVPRGRASNPLTQFALVTKETRMLTAEKQAELTKLLDGNADLLSGLLGQVAATDKAAQDQGVAYKDTPDIRAIIREELASLLGQTTEKAGPMMGGGMMADEETPAEDTAEGGVEEPGEENMLTSAEIAAIAQQTAQVLLDSLMPHLGIGQKMDEVKSLLGGMAGSYAKKDAETAEIKAELEKVKAQVDDLSGSQPRIMAGGFRASQAASTITTDETKLKDAQPAADPVAQSFGAFMTDLFGNLPGQAAPGA